MNKGKIIEGLLNSLLRTRYVEKIAVRRNKLCSSNVCGLYNAPGNADNCFVPGQPCCAGCGCKLAWKQRSLASHCYLKDMGQTPLWEAEMTEDEEKKYREKTGLKND